MVGTLDRRILASSFPSHYDEELRVAYPTLANILQGHFARHQSQQQLLQQLTLPEKTGSESGSLDFQCYGFGLRVHWDRGLRVWQCRADDDDQAQAFATQQVPGGRAGAACLACLCCNHRRLDRPASAS